MPEPLVYGLNTLRIEMLRPPPRLMLATLGILLGLGPAAGVAETEWARLNVYGMPGHVEMPSAFRLPDAEAGLSLSRPSIRAASLSPSSSRAGFRQVFDMRGCPGTAIFMTAASICITP